MYEIVPARLFVVDTACLNRSCITWVSEVQSCIVIPLSSVCITCLLYQLVLLTLWLQRFLYPSLGTELIFYKPSPGTDIFPMFTIWHGLFSLVLVFTGLRIEAPPPSTVQDKCIYTFLKLKASRFHFSSYVLNLVMIHISLFSFKGWQSRDLFMGQPCLASTCSSADLSTKCARTVESGGPISAKHANQTRFFLANCIQRVNIQPGVRYSVKSLVYSWSQDKLHCLINS